MSTIRHFHQCQDCQAKTLCTGTLEDNFDGEPPITCQEFHLSDGTLNPDWICDGCQVARNDAATADAQRMVG